MQPLKVTKSYARQIARLHEVMGISPDYAAKHSLELQLEARRFVYVGMEPRGRDHFLIPTAAKAWKRMQKSASAQGIDIILLSGFRSVERQRFLIEEIVQKKSQTLEQVLTRLAAPGYSEHHTGRALDIATPDDPYLEERFEQSQAFQWLLKNAGEFGFRLSFPRNNKHGLIYEPWHWYFAG